MLFFLVLSFNRWRKQASRFFFRGYIFRTFPNSVILMFTATSRLTVLTLFVCCCYYLSFFCFYFISCFFLPFSLYIFSIIITFSQVCNMHVYFNYVMIQIEPKSIQYLINTWYWIVFLTDIDPIHDLGVGQKDSPKNFSS